MISWFRRRARRHDRKEAVRAASNQTAGTYTHLDEQTQKADRIGWEKLRREHGLSEGERLYVGKYKSGKLGGRTSVWVDGNPLNGRLFLSYGLEDEIEVTTLDDVLADYDPAIFGGDLNEHFDTEGVYRKMVIHNKYDPTTVLGKQELALNVLADLVGEGRALRCYEAFAVDFAEDLARDLWSLPGDQVRGWVGRKEWAAKKRRR